MNNSGQTLVEIIFAVGILALIGVAIVSLSTSAVRNNSYAEKSTEANKYALEGMEWIRFEKEKKWQNVWPHAGNGPPPGNINTFCFSCLSGIDDLCSDDWSQNEESCNLDNPDDFISGTIYQREIKLGRRTLDTGCSVSNECFKATVSVKWTDSQGPHSIDTTTIFSDWQ